MAPTKKDADKGEKEAKLTPEQSATMMLEYLRKTNRPYSANDISTNLKNRVTKASAAKLLKDMHERGEVEGKAAGKQIVYHALQDEADAMDVDTLQALDEQTAHLVEETTALKAEEKDLRVALREGTTQVPLAELQASLAALEQNKAELEARLAKLRGGNLKPVSAEERERVSKEYKRWMRCAGNRRKIRVEVWKVIEGFVEEKEVSDLKESLGLEF